MVIDDDRGIADLLSVVLKNNGYTPITAPNGYAAQDILTRCPQPILILSDYAMPIVNGCELIETISQHSYLQHIPAIIMTGSDIDSLRLPITHNFKGIIQKPFKISTILETIRYYENIGECDSSICPA
jgi:CheY-like chemotaxis protein